MYHQVNLGSFGENVPCDLNGYIPEVTDEDPFAFNIDHGVERTHDDAGELTEYGEWWGSDGFMAWKDAAIDASVKAQSALCEWQVKTRR